MTEHQQDQDQRQRIIKTNAFRKLIEAELPAAATAAAQMDAVTTRMPAAVAAFLPAQNALAAQCVWEEDNGAKLYLGNASAVYGSSLPDLIECNVRAIVNCTPRPNDRRFHHLPEDSDDDANNGTIRYCQVPIQDCETANIIMYFPATNLFLHHHLRERQHSVLVHCRAGISRSATIVLAYLMQFHDLSLDEAITTVRSRRPIVQPNVGFMAQLRAWEAELRQKQNNNNNDSRWHDDIIPAVVTADTDSSAASFDCDWPARSLALFATLRHVVPHVDYRALCFGGVPVSDETTYQALDLVWGHGVSDVVLDWLAGWCGTCSSPLPIHDDNVDGRVATVTAATTTTTTQRVIDMINDPASKFAQNFAGEIYPHQIEKVKATLLLLRRQPLR
jgi:protein-tyrosine phosphatase